MEIGKLNQRITVLEHHTKIDSIGNHITKWEEIFSLWAMVIVKNSSETTEAGITKNVQTVEFLVRMTSNMLNANSTTHCILFRGVMYDIIGILPFYDHNSYMKIQVTARKAGVEDA